MINQETMAQLTAKLSALLAEQPSLTDAAKQKITTCLQASLSQLDLVTREEFDAQVKVLEKTRLKLEHLEQLLAEAKKDPEQGQ